MPFKHGGISMLASTYIIAAISFVAIIVAFFAGRYLFASKSSSQFSVDQTSAVDIARLQERERSLLEQVKRLEGQALTLNADWKKMCANWLRPGNSLLPMMKG